MSISKTRLRITQKDRDHVLRSPSPPFHEEKGEGASLSALLRSIFLLGARRVPHASHESCLRTGVKLSLLWEARWES